MSFWDRFESTRDGIEDTIEFTIRTAVVTLSAVILVVVCAFGINRLFGIPVPVWSPLHDDPRPLLS